MPLSCGHWDDRFSTQWARDGIICTDVIQGHTFNNCCVMAALSSIAHVNPGFLNKTPSQGYYLMKISNWFYKVNSKVLADSQNIPLGANPYDELWPAIWEKAYAAYLLVRNPTAINQLSDNDSRWDGICTLNWESTPLIALANLLGRSAPLPRTIKPASGPQIPVNTIIDEIKSFSSECGTGTNNWKVSAAKMVAWTYYDSNHIPTTNIDPRVVPIPYIYNNTISANHSYAILGLVYDAAGVLYIVLRNPVDVCTPISGAPTTWCGTPNILNGDRGMIAVPDYLFHAVFQAYGWIY